MKYLNDIESLIFCFMNRAGIHLSFSNWWTTWTFEVTMHLLLCLRLHVFLLARNAVILTKRTHFAKRMFCCFRIETVSVIFHDIISPKVQNRLDRIDWVTSSKLCSFHWTERALSGDLRCVPSYLHTACRRGLVLWRIHARVASVWRQPAELCPCCAV